MKSPLQQLFSRSHDEFGSKPADLLVMADDAIHAWRESKQAATSERCLEREEVALINTFQCLQSALRLAGVSPQVASSVFRELVDASQVQVVSGR